MRRCIQVFSVSVAALLVTTGAFTIRRECALALTETRAAVDSVVFSFVILGCNRIQAADWKKIKNDDPSSANLPQLQQSFVDISKLNPLPNYVFFTGDLVLNLEQDDGKILRSQLDAWSQLYRASPLVGKTTLVPMTGNHEMLQEIDQAGKKVEASNPATDPVWVDWLHQNGFDRFAGNGPTPAGQNLDRLQDDQSKLTYSFNDGDRHFIIINTDTLTTTKNVGWIALNWIKNDVESAQRNPQAKGIYLFGHKPITPPIETASQADAGIFNDSSSALANQLQSVLLANPKVKGYFCAHAHLWEARPLMSSTQPWQVIAGNAGSQLESNWAPAGGTYYGFTVVNVYGSGTVGIVSYTRPVPDPYYADSAPPGRPQSEIMISSSSP